MAQLPIIHHLVSRQEFDVLDSDQYANNNNYVVANGDVVSFKNFSVVAHGDQDANGLFVGDFGQVTNAFDVTVFGRDEANTNEVQTLTITGTPTGGDFTITFSGQTTGVIAYNADAATIETALEALSNIEVGEATVAGSNPGPFTVTFSGQYAETNVPLMTTNAAGLTGGTSPDVTVGVTTEGGLGDTAIAVGEPVYKDVAIDEVNADATNGTFFGYALEAVAANEAKQIRVIQL